MEEYCEYVIWVGSVFSDEYVLKHTAISPAANKWQLNFINALQKTGVKVVNIGHCPERVFPFGKIFVNKRSTLIPEKITFLQPSYLNIPFLRIVLINILGTLKLADYLNKSKTKPIYLIGYNTYSYNVLPLLFAKFIKKIKWVSLVTDPMNDKSNKINPFYKLADAKVYLSYKLFQSENSLKKLHFDGGIKKTFDLNNSILQNGEKIILYTGAIALHTGIELLVDAFGLLKARNVRLIICGKGSNEYLEKELVKNDHISFMGMVDESKLEFLYSEAFLFINPRLINKKTNNSNFPSKLLEYLSYCKPVISTYTGGINPFYKEVIQFVYSDNPQELADKIDEVISWDNNQYIQNSENIRIFVEKHKKWSTLIPEFNMWAKNT